MSIVRWEPFREFDDFFRKYSRTLGRSLTTEGGKGVEWSPTANISETDKEYLIKAELPEVKKEDVKITVENGLITISGERKHHKEEKDENEIRVESFYGEFSRSFSLPDDAESKNIRAESKDGVLRIHIPKSESAKPKAVTIPVQ